MTTFHLRARLQVYNLWRQGMDYEHQD
ncbi:uncharacterized protein G2W53_044251 [Senna tora]|uniref:Uncharacterized protein n=1 Tax=Senna tora TaxID=362788 RepID=A0A834SMK2_9FABA|nr:uncharacterized protein G2W53_044251 [Senna tora]